MALQPQARSVVQQVAAVSLLSAVAHILSFKLKRQADSTSLEQNAGLTELSASLQQEFSTMSLDCSILHQHGRYEKLAVLSPCHM